MPLKICYPLMYDTKQDRHNMLNSHTGVFLFPQFWNDPVFAIVCIFPRPLLSFWVWYKVILRFDL